MKIIYLFFIFINVLWADPSFGIIPNINIEDKDKYNLGKQLFYDKNLSKDKKISCASCHNLELYGTDNKKVYRGVNNSIGKLNSPTIFNTKFNISFDGAGETTTLLSRTKMSFLKESEMAGDIKEMLYYISSDLALSNSFVNVYGAVTPNNVFDSISYFVENLLSPNSKFDLFLQGDDSLLNEDELKGYTLFKEYGCVSCHNGINVGGNMYQKLGVFKEPKLDDNTLGRYRITHLELDKNVFKVPSLRNITKTAPYLHDGSFKTLDTTIERMGIFQLGIKIDSKDIYYIKKFLNTLTGDTVDE